MMADNMALMRALAAIALLSATATLWTADPSAHGFGSPERLALRTAWSARLSAERFDVRLDTSKGPIVIAVHHGWAPHGADRFHELVTSHYFDDSRFFRVVKGQWAQFGIAGDPAAATAWRSRTFPDDPRGQSNTRGRVAFAFAVPNGRTTQVYISLRDNSYQDEQGFVPFGEVVDGMDVADALSTEYGENAGGGIRGGKQQPLFDGGNAYLDREFPRLDRLIKARVMP